VVYLVIFVTLTLGACLGSFLGVVLDRVPRGESIVSPPSHCDECGHWLRAWELVPILSYVAQRGRCRRCAATLPAWALLLEVACALVLTAAAFVIVR
jgi:leader peptidase (prepilin peptidase)/N-methyltransferase